MPLNKPTFQDDICPVCGIEDAVSLSIHRDKPYEDSIIWCSAGHVSVRSGSLLRHRQIYDFKSEDAF